MKKLRAASLSPNAGLLLREFVLYAPRRWDRMTASERKVVERVHMLLSAGRLIQTFQQRDDGSWRVRPLRQAVESDDEDGIKRPYRWWPVDALPAEVPPQLEPRLAGLLERLRSPR